jgi:hypothetical protein
MEQLNKLLKEWKVARDSALESHNWRVQNTYNICIQNLEATLKRINEPCNTRMHVDTKPKKHNYRECPASAHYDGAEYCYSCGGRL